MIQNSCLGLLLCQIMAVSVSQKGWPAGTARYWLSLLGIGWPSDQLVVISVFGCKPHYQSTALCASTAINPHNNPKPYNPTANGQTILPTIVI